MRLALYERYNICTVRWLSKNIMKKNTCFILIVTIIILTLFSYQKIQLLLKPNIIFIVLDAARADHFSCFGYDKNTTPCIAAIAKNSLVFENHFSQSTKTTLSLSCIFFSRYFTLQTIEDDNDTWGIKKEYPWTIFMQFDPNQVFLTKLLSLQGYKTALFSDHSWLDKKSYFVNQFDEFFVSKKINESIELDRNVKINNVIPKIVSLIKKHKYRRYFIYWHILFPHAPYPPGVENKELLSNINKETIDLVRQKYKETPNDSAITFNEDEIKCLKGLYDSNLRYADTMVGILYEKLKSDNLLHNTMIIITADHGEFLGDHGLLRHGGPSWDSVIKVPLILFYPKLTNREIRIKELTQSIDIMPTILDICRIKLPKNKSVDGTSLKKYLDISYLPETAVFGKDYIRTKKYKYLIDEKLFFDLEEDPEEKNPIYQKETAIKKMLLDMHEQTMKPYRKRYEKSVRNTPPDYPFYIPVSTFKIGPRYAIEECSTNFRYEPEFLNKVFVNKAWLLGREWGSKDLYYLPNENYLSPITLSTNIPNGIYRIYLLLESKENINSSVDKFGLRYKFNTKTDFSFPSDMKLFRKSDNSHFYYLYFGKTEVIDKKFFIKIDFRSTNGQFYVIKHIKFVPFGVSDNLNDKNDSLKDEEFQEKLETLKSLGYL